MKMKIEFTGTLQPRKILSKLIQLKQMLQELFQELIKLSKMQKSTKYFMGKGSNRYVKKLITHLEPTNEEIIGESQTLLSEKASQQAKKN